MTKMLPHILKQGRTRRGAALALLLALVSAAAFLAAAGRGQSAHAQDLRAKLNRFAQEGGAANASPSAKLLRAGRDQIDEEKWAQAAETLKSFLEKYPRDKEADAAAYWYSYALGKQGRTADAVTMLKRMISAHPRSNWVDDSRALLVQLDPKAGEELDKAANVELKIVALQTLMENNPESAMQYVRDILRTGSTANPRMKEMAVSLVASQGGAKALPMLLEIARDQQAEAKLRRIAIHFVGEEGGEAAFDDLVRIYDAERSPEIKRQLLRAFGDTKSPRGHQKLLAIARNPSETGDARRAAIHWLGENTASAYDDLLQIYNSDQNVEVRRQLVHAFSDMKDPRGLQKLVEIARGTAGERVELRRSAIHFLADKEGEQYLDELMRIFENDPSVEIKRQVLHAFADMKSPRARAKVAEVARGQNFPAELRRTAISHYIDGRDDEASVAVIVGFYDSETSADIKRTLLHALGQSKQKSALRKLMAVARNQAEPIDLRRTAISRIGESKDPEAKQFLEDLLKP
ncbi:MAG: tetratricopeptide repeat protein [Acidobacteria bacterium]|nr:tetratricopeptide repeat protein [Acidobacteriota bacterium]